MVKKRNIISFEISEETAGLWASVKSNPKTHRGFQAQVLRRLFENFLADFDNWNDITKLDEDIRVKFSRYQKHHQEHKGRMLQIETQRMIYWNAMVNAFKETNIPILYVKFELDLMADYIEVLRSRVFEQTEGELSLSKELVSEFILDKIEELEASGEMNQIRCKEQMNDYGEESFCKSR